MVACKFKNILIVDGYATGSQYAGRIKARNLVPYHITSGWEKHTSFTPEFMDKYIASQVQGRYAECFRMPDDMDEAVEMLKKYNFQAVIPGTETGVIAAETLAQKLGLPTNKRNLLQARRDKFYMQMAMKEAGLKYIDSFLAHDVEEAVQWYKKSGYPRILIKPAKSAGTDGVGTANNEEELRQYFTHSYLHKYDAAGNYNDALLLQEYIVGDEMVVNCVSREGRHVLTDVVLYNKVMTPNGVPIYDASRLIHHLDERFSEAVQYTFKVLDALGIQYGSSHSEIKLTSQGPVLVETGARVMGSTPENYYEALGYSLIDWSLDSYLDDAAHLAHSQQKYAPKKHFLAKFFISSEDAPITALHAPETLKMLPSFATCNFNTLNISKQLKKTVDIPSKPGDCLLISDDEQTLLRDYNLCRYLEKCATELLWTKKDNKKEKSPVAKQLLKALQSKQYPDSLHQEINRFLYGYNLAYKNYKNAVLYVLHDNLMPCLAGETGTIYVAGAYLSKQAHKMRHVKKENFINNPFYTTAGDMNLQYPMLYNTQDKAKIEENGEVTFIDKSGHTISSFGPAKHKDSWPLTYTERQMLAEQQLSPDSNAYNAKFTFKLVGKLDVKRLQQALKTWVSRYRIFNSYYPYENGKFVHKLAKDFPVEINTFTCSYQEALQHIEKGNLPYDLTQGPLYRFSLFKTSNKEHLFHINMHHVISDGTSLISIIEELWKLYKNKRAKKFRLEKEDFLDYAVWYNEHDDSESKKEFFLDLFKDGVPENEMPIRSTRPEILPHATEISRPIYFDVATIDHAAKRMKISPALFVMTAVSLVLAKYCGSEDLALGVIMNGRSHPQTKEMFGMFVNSVPVRFKPKSQLSLAQYVQENAQMFKGAIENQTCPFELLAPLLAPQRNLARKPVFDAIVNYRGEIPSFETDGIKINSIQMWQSTQIDLQFEIIRSVSDMNITISYSQQLYHPDIINGMLDLLEKVINTMCQENALEQTLEKIKLLPFKHNHKLLTEFAGKREDWNLEKTIVDIFRKNAVLQPRHPAVCYENKKFSYAEVEHLSDNLAQLLLDNGIQKNDKVALLINRSELLPICALGILKTAAAYVPMDPSHPKERLQFILQDTQAKVVIADEDLFPLISEYSGKVLSTQKVRTLDKTKSAWSTASIAQVHPTAEDLFVVLYTSGTTGNPKGVMLKHRNIMGLCLGAKQYFSLCQDDNIASCAGFGFDACISDIYPSFFAGACVHIISQDLRIDLTALNEYFEKNHITGVLLTTQLGRQFVTGVENHSLRYMIVGGETLTPVQPPAHYKLYNAYGPTEATVYTSFSHVDKFYDRVPLGKPVHNADIYITDKDGNLAPIGTFGELCISGNHVSAGYLNLPAMTDERFVPNPFNSQKGFEKMYKTGDIARYTPDGNIDFLGRRDSQVKVRGFRIELSEIETCLRKYPNLQDCTVIAKADKSGNNFIVGYAVSAQQINFEDVRRFMEDELPPYMIPDFFMQLPVIPLNPNGKVDRARLPDVLQEGSFRKEKYQAPKGRVEKELALIWSDILNIDAKTIGRNDSFFEMGGTSLRSTELSLRVRQAFKESMSPSVIFKFPKLKDQAVYLNKKNRFSMVYAFNEEGTKTPIFFVHTANTGAEAYVPLAQKLPKDQPFYAVEPHNIFSEDSSIRGIEKLAAQYIRYIQKVSPEGPYILGGWSFGAVVAYEMARQLRAAGKTVENVYLLDPIIEHCQEEKELTRQLLETSFFQGYLNNDPLFGRFKKLGFMDKLVQNNKNVLEDMFAYIPQPYEGVVTLFKATRLEAAPKDVDKKLAAQLRKFQVIHRDKLSNGFDKYVKNLCTVKINAIHNYMMRGNSLEIIADTIIGRKPNKRK